MWKPIKTTTLLFLFTLAGCATTTDLRNSKSDPKVVFNAPVVKFLGTSSFNKDWVMGDIIRVDGKRVNPEAIPVELVLSPGVHEVEMRWRSSRRPINKKNYSTNNNLVPLYGAVATVNSYRSSNTFTLTANFEPNSRYYVNLAPNIINGTEFAVPNRLCLSKIPLDKRYIEKAVSGIARVVSDGPIVACSQ